MKTIIAPDSNNQLEDLFLGVVIDDKTQKQFVPTTALITVTVGGIAVVSAAGASIAANGEVSYNFTVSESNQLTDALPIFDCKALWVLDDGATTLERIQYFDISLVKIRTDVTDDMLIRSWPLSSQYRDVNTRGKSKQGSTTTVIVDQDRIEAANYFVGGKLKFSTGANANSNRRIVAFNPSNNTITVTPAFVYLPNVGDSYEIHDSFSPQRIESWQVILRRMNQSIKKEAVGKIEDGMDLTEAHKALTLALIAEAHIQSKDDQFELASGRFRMDYETAMSQAQIKIDTVVSALNTGSGVKKTIRFWGK